MDTDREPNPHVPPLVADAFVRLMRDRGVVLGFDRDSLESDFDLVLDLDIFRDPNAESLRIASIDADFDMESAASAYLGETLARMHSGIWTGHFSNESIVNFYCSIVSFGSFNLKPICWLSYRVSHGREEGAVCDWLGRVLPSIEARSDLTAQTRLIEDIY